jgi:hypothetical protein
MSHENVELIRQLVPISEADLVQPYREDPLWTSQLSGRFATGSRLVGDLP